MITALRYMPEQPTQARLIVAGATGVPQQFYRRVAQFMSERGFDTLTLDYRGVGLSAPPRQWRRWCGFPHYFFDDPEMAHLKAQFNAVRAPIAAANSVDDLWAPPASRDAFMVGYRQAPVQTITLRPGDFGMRTIGHMGDFKSQAHPLWQQVLDWFAANRPNSAATYSATD